MSWFSTNNGRSARFRGNRADSRELRTPIDDFIADADCERQIAEHYNRIGATPPPGATGGVTALAPKCPVFQIEQLRAARAARLRREARGIARRPIGGDAA